jgi:hypothetical protein
MRGVLTVHRRDGAVAAVEEERVARKSHVLRVLRPSKTKASQCMAKRMLLRQGMRRRPTRATECRGSPARVLTTKTKLLTMI